MQENEVFDLKGAKETYSEKRAYIEGIKYYFKKITKSKGILVDEDLAAKVKAFGEAFNLFREMDSSGELFEMDEIFGRFYPDGNIDPRLITLHLQLAFDSISEYMMHLKKMYF